MKDFLRTDLPLQSFSPIQLEIASKGMESDEFLKKIVKLMDKGGLICPPQDFPAALNAFNLRLNAIKQRFAPDVEKMTADFLQLSKEYNKLYQRSGEIKPDIYENFIQFAGFLQTGEIKSEEFDQLLKQGVPGIAFLEEDNRKKNSKALPTVHSFKLFEIVRESLLPLIDEASDQVGILARLAHACLTMRDLSTHDEKEVAPDDLLSMMHRQMGVSSFVEKIRQRYRAAIIDEFQDTDPIQWEIFSTCFLTGEHLCYLVGDPKQSIYAFRRADIYTYLNASEAMGASCKATLEVNYRSQPQLINALNTLFLHSPSWMALPKRGKYLEIGRVKAPEGREAAIYPGQLGSIHFCLAEGELGRGSQWPSDEVEEGLLFPSIAEEIKKLHVGANLSLNQCAILVKDRYQASRLHQFLKKSGIPSITKRNISLVNSEALPALEELLNAILSPWDESLVKIALGGQILGWRHDQVEALKDERLSSQMTSLFLRWKETWQNSSFPHLVAQIFEQTLLLDEKCVSEKILERSDGLNFYQELQQLIELILEEEGKGNRSPAFVQSFLKNLKKSPENSSELNIRFIEEQQAVQILTLHFSKGLEYDVVFALGLANRTTKSDDLIPADVDGIEKWIVANQKTAAFKLHCEEKDAEKMRQLYVAMTRARERLYLPFVLPSEESSDKRRPEMGAASPMELFLARLIEKPGEKPSTYEELYDRIEKLAWPDIEQLLNEIKNKAEITYEYLVFNAKGGKDCIEGSLTNAGNISLNQPSAFIMPGDVGYLHSYSSLHSLVKKSSSQKDHIQPEKIDEKDAEILPLGAQTGVLLHRLLQEIPFEQFCQANKPEELSCWIAPYVRGSIYEPWQQEIEKLLFNVFQAPLKGRFGNFCLKEVDPKKTVREMEFLFPWDEPINCEEICAQINFHGGSQEGMLTGFIDLIFCHQEVYYLLDWKSNWLGPASHHYEETALQKAMEEHAYYLQEEIYRLALRKYLKLVDKRPFEDAFGGSYYLFLRGVDVLAGTLSALFIK